MSYLKSIKMFITKPISILLMCLYSIGMSEASSCIQISLRVQAEFFEKSVSKASRLHILTTSSSSFRRDYKKLAVSSEISASFMGFSGSAQAAYEGVTDASENFSSSRHEEKSEEVSYHPGFLQIERVLTTQVSINGKLAKMVTREFVDSVSVNNNESPEKLKQRGKNYIRDNFGYLAGEKGVSLRNNVYSATACVPFKECQPLDDSTCPGDDNYCEISGKCVGYQHYDEKICTSGTYVDGVHEKDNLDAAISGCNEDSQCGCIRHNGPLGYGYFLYKGTEAYGYYSGWEAWVKT